jgi:hypothetical protein
MLRLTAVVLLISALLAACQIAPLRSDDSPFYKVPSGSKLRLNSKIIIPPNSVKIYIQEGQLVAAANQYYPFCRFDVRNLKEIPQPVEPDEIEIYRTSWVTDLIAELNRHSLLAMTSRLDFGDKPSPIVYGVQMDLRSAKQPDVFRLMCGHLQDPNIEARYLSVNQIRATLGKVFTLQLPEPKP